MTKIKMAAKPGVLNTKALPNMHVIPVLKADDEGIQRCSLCRRPFFPAVEKVAFSFKAHIEQRHITAYVTKMAGSGKRSIGMAKR
jgi:hypothetical protein